MKVTILFLFGLVLACPGHTDISTTIKKLSAKIEEAPGADLYYQRATEYRALREYAHARADLRAALALEPDHLPSQIALIEALGDRDEALTRALKLSTSVDQRTSLQGASLLAAVHQKRGELEEALKIIRRLDELTRKARKGDTSIDLRHADLLLELDRPGEAATVLKAAWDRTDSIVIRNNWIDTALTAGETDEVLPIIEKELRSSRFRSSWYIRRARALRLRNREAAARADLRAALEEINPRINPRRPDLTLIADRGLIHALMGHNALAQRDLTTLSQSSYPASAYRLLREHLADAD